MSNDAAFPPETPRLIAGRYRLGRALGKGTYGQVFYAEDIKFEPPRTVAVKLLHPQFLSDNQSREDVRREASVLARFHHPNILRVSDFEISSEMAYIVTDFAEGGSLANKIKPEAGAPPVPLPLNEVIYYLEQIASALDEAHNLGLIHRDIKPLNILLDRSGRPLLADFGLATVLSGTSSSMVDLSASGTPLYMAPEQWAGKAGKASDIYALGVVTYQLITGQPPYQGNQAALWAQHTGAPIPPLREKAPWLDYPPALDAVIAGVMAKDDRERTRPAGEFARRFKMALLGFQATPYNLQNIPPRYIQGQSGSLPPATFQPGSNLPPSTVPPQTAPSGQPPGQPGSQPHNYPAGFNNNAGPGAGGRITGPTYPPNYGSNPPAGPTYGPPQTLPQSFETTPSTPLSGPPSGQGQGSQPNVQTGSQGSTQVSGPPPGRPEGFQAGPPYPNQPYWGQPGIPPGQPQGSWNNGEGRAGPVVTKKKSGLNPVLLGALGLVVVAAIVAAVLLLLPKGNGSTTPTQVAANATATTAASNGTAAPNGNGNGSVSAADATATAGAAVTGKLQVTVTEANGKPAREADVTIQVFNAGTKASVDTSYNKASATFNLPPGSYTVQASYPNDVSVTGPAIEVKEGQSATQALNFGVGTVQVEVVEAPGRSPREGDVTLQVFKAGDTSRAVTTVYGKAKTGIFLTPGSYQIQTAYSNGVEELGPAFQITEGQVTTQSVNLAVGTAQVEVDATAGKVALDNSMVLVVHKQDDPNVEVTTIYGKARTNITLKEGSYTIDVDYGGGTVKLTSQPVAIKAGQTTPATITLGIGQAQIQIQLADGTKLDESKLSWRIYAQDDPNDNLATVYNKATSSFFLKPGTYVVVVAYNGGAEVTGDPFEVKEGQTSNPIVKI
jgi:serine/threonine-protein kinase